MSDLGLRHAKLGYQSNNISGYLENIVFLELLRRKYKVNIGKQNNKEIDFVANLRDENLYLQVTYLLASEETIEREFLPLKSIKDNYSKLVLSMDNLPESNVEGIKRKKIIDFLLEK